MPSFEYMCMRWLIDMCISLIPVMLVFGFKAWFHISNIVFNAIPVFPEGVIVFGDGAFPQGLDAYMAEYTVFMLFMCAALRGFPARPVLAMIVLCLTIFIWCFIGAVGAYTAHFDATRAMATGQFSGVACTGVFLIAYLLQDQRLSSIFREEEG